MLIRRVSATNFRGILQAEWHLPDQRFLCLVGPGDSTKTTLLDTIALVLNPRWTATFTDADFHGCETTCPIIIRLLIGDLDDKALSDTAFGLHLTGLKPDGTLEHDPSPESEPCVLMQLKVDSDLDPSWTVVRQDEDDDGVPLTSGQRKAMGLFRVDDRVDTHLRWGRGSALSRLTDEGTSTAVIAAQRAARTAVFEQPASPLHDTAKSVATAAAALGGGDFADVRPGWDPAASASASALLLHDGQIPLTHAGLGSRRLISVAAQEQASAQGHILIVDEIEHGLEPHRLIHLIEQLRRNAARGRGQVIVTTHSPVVVQALNATDICVVQNTGGHTQVRHVSAEMQGAFRAVPAAVLARQVIVGEGATETGIIRAFIQHWDSQRTAQGQAGHAALGVTFLDGKGDNAPLYAKIFQDLGFTTSLVADHDARSADAAITKAVSAGVTVFRWRPGHSTELEVTSTLDIDQLGNLVAVAVELKGRDAVSDQLVAAIKGLAKPDALSPAAWQAIGLPAEQLRHAIGTAAGKGTWFKRQDYGEHLARFIVDNWPHFQSTHLGRELTRLRQTIYQDQEPSDSQ